MKKWYLNLFSKSYINFLILLGAASILSNNSWRILFNNFAIDVVNMDSLHIGILQSLREVPGLLVFTVLFFLIFIKEQKMIVISTSILGIGVALTGYLPSIYGFYFTTVIMSIGFHYIESLHSSLSTQFFDKKDFSSSMGELRSANSFFAILSFVFIILLLRVFKLDYKYIYLICGCITILISLYLFSFKQAKQVKYEKQINKIFLRKKYTIFYLLTLLAGARRQIIVVFAGLLLVQKFYFTVVEISYLFLTTHIVTMLTAPLIGKIIDKLGSKLSLSIEYILLILIFISYYFVESAMFASLLYILDSLVFSFSLALITYFKRIANTEDISVTTSMSFTINHIIAVFLPFLLGYLWLFNYRIVFLIAICFSICSLVITQFIRK